MDDLNKKRLEKGQPLSTHGKGEEELNQMATEAVKASGYDGRVYSGPQNNPVLDYHLSKWLPFGGEQDYEGPASLAALMGYSLKSFQVEGGGRYLYFDHDKDRGGAFRVVYLWEECLIEVYRSLPYVDMVKNPLSRYSRLLEGPLEKVVARRDGLLMLQVGSRAVELLWDSPYSEEAPDLQRDAEALSLKKASSDYPLVAYS